MKWLIEHKPEKGWWLWMLGVLAVLMAIYATAGLTAGDMVANAVLFLAVGLGAHYGITYWYEDKQKKAFRAKLRGKRGLADELENIAKEASQMEELPPEIQASLDKLRKHGAMAQTILANDELLDLMQDGESGFFHDLVMTGASAHRGLMETAAAAKKLPKKDFAQANVEVDAEMYARFCVGYLLMAARLADANAKTAKRLKQHGDIVMDAVKDGPLKETFGGPDSPKQKAFLESMTAFTEIATPRTLPNVRKKLTAVMNDPKTELPELHDMYGSKLSTPDSVSVAKVKTERTTVKGAYLHEKDGNPGTRWERPTNTKEKKDGKAEAQAEPDDKTVH